MTHSSQDARFVASLVAAATGVALIAACSGTAASNGVITAVPDLPPCSSATATDPVTPPILPGWALVWHDEFQGTGLPDASHWGYDTGNSGFGNHEAETYYADNAPTARVECGNLVITTSHVLNAGHSEYPSARLKTAGKAMWKYGRIEVRAKLPQGVGTWPAIWMMPETEAYGGWPNSGEIDIMEHVGFDPNVIHGTVHTQAFNHTIGTQKGQQILVPGAMTDFHVYAIEWSADRIDFYVDATKYFTFANSGNGPAEWPFDQAFFLIINTAVGGDWGGQHGIDDSIFPQQMLVDYVRVYQRP